MSSTAVQLVVIGAGPGGYAAAFYAADMGLTVALVDPELNPGGVCLYRGCIPSKALLHVAQLIGESKHASAWGVSFPEPKIDLDKLRTFKNNVVQKMVGGLGQLSKARKINYIQGRASFVDAKSLSIELVKGGTDTLTFDHAIIATGSRPVAVPNVSIESPRVMDSTGALDLPDIPKSLLVVGGGYIGLELGSVYAALGTKVTVVEMTGGLLPGADRDLANILTKRLETTLHKILLNAGRPPDTFNYKSVDLRVEKIFQLPAQQQASIAFEGFNIFNTTNFSCYDGNIPVLPSTNANFGQPSCTVDNSSRRLQFGLRYSF